MGNLSRIYKSKSGRRGKDWFLYDYTKLQKEEVLGDLILKYRFLSLLAY